MDVEVAAALTASAVFLAACRVFFSIRSFLAFRAVAIGS